MRLFGVCVPFCVPVAVLGVVTLAACSGAKPTELDYVPVGGAQLPVFPRPDDATDAGGVGRKSDGGGGGKTDAGVDSGEVEEEVDVLCDNGLALASASADDAAKAIGLCKKAKPGGGPGWGVIEARWSKPDGTPNPSNLSWGLLPKLGSIAAPSGKVMLALSTGTARGPGDPGYQPTGGHDKGYTHAAPPGHPKPFAACAASDPEPGAPHDGVALELKIRVPVDANSMSFTHQLLTADTPNDVCTQYNDVFVALMEPKPAGTDGNIVFDALGDPIGVNSAILLRACVPGTYKGRSFTCPLGTASLAGTGFDTKSATGWLRTTVPVKAGADITLRFAIWDSGDGILDSTVLIDELGFSSQTAGAALTVPR